MKHQGIPGLHRRQQGCKVALDPCQVHLVEHEEERLRSLGICPEKEAEINGRADSYGAELDQLDAWIRDFGVSSEDLKNFSVAALLTRLGSETEDSSVQEKIAGLLGAAKRFGIADEKAGKVLKKIS